MIKDARKNLEIEYNSLNLLTEVKQGSTSKAKYTYASDGTKPAVVGNGDGYDYRGSLIYKRSGRALSLESASFSDGRITKTNSTYVPSYFITDYLGSVRVIFDASGTVLEQNDYYAFGGKHLNSALTASDNRFKYNGKELQTTGDVGFLDYGVRMYNSKLGRWFVQDPLQELFYNISSYAYCLNNPARYIDLFGMSPDDPESNMHINIPDVIVKPEKKPSFNFGIFLFVHSYNTFNYREKNYDIWLQNLGDLTKKAQLAKVEGFWENLSYYLYGRTYEYGGINYTVNRNGEITGRAPITGMAPSPGKVKGGSIFIKGAGKVNRKEFHTVKKVILKTIGTSKFEKVVGTNPDISISGMGKIVLKGTKEGGFLNKTYNTELKLNDFINIIK